PPAGTTMGSYVEAPAEYTGAGPSVFLAGGITGCPGWQDHAARGLAGLPLDVLNPRRADFPIDDPSAAEAQIAWEHRHLRRATAALFWFPCETLCPLTRYERGASRMAGGPLFAGTPPESRRRSDVVIQTRLARPDVRVVADLDELLDQVRAWCAGPR